MVFSTRFLHRKHVDVGMPLSQQELTEILPVLYKLLHSNCEGRECILEGVSEDIVRCLSECAHNYLQGNLPATVSQQTILQKAQSKLKLLASTACPSKRKRRLLRRGAHFLGPLISIALPILLKLISQ